MNDEAIRTRCLSIKDRKQWRMWLQKNHAKSSGVRIVVYRKHAAQNRLSYLDAVEEALCFGWIDTQPNAMDADRFSLQMTPRRPKSVWSNNNKRRVESLIVRDLMTQAGRDVVERAKQDGSWHNLDSIDALELPPDFQAALAANRAARDNFACLSASSKKLVLWWIASAKKPDTRAKRVSESVAMAERNDVSFVRRK